jgi:hypothetical protein
MMKLFTQMLRYPLTVFVATVEAFVGAVREIQKTTEKTIDTMTGGVAQALSNSPGVQGGSPNSQMTGGVIADDANNATLKEESNMSDQDLGGTDLKYVSYSILFTKADLETTLEQQEEDLVNYSTNGGSYGALKMSDFFKDLEKNGRNRPSVWKENGYPENAGDKYFSIPDEDLKYVTFIYQVDRRLDKNSPNYPKEQVTVLKQIRDRL